MKLKKKEESIIFQKEKKKKIGSVRPTDLLIYVIDTWHVSAAQAMGHPFFDFFDFFYSFLNGFADLSHDFC